MGQITAQKLKGFRDYLPEQAKLRRQLIESLYHRAELAGFLPIDTPAIEYAETLLGQGGEETDKEVYRFTDHGERSVALRFDLTVPFARFVAENFATLPMPFKKVQAGEVWRGEKPQKGRYRQFCQADVDIIGADSVEADVEVMTILAQVVTTHLAQPALGLPAEKRRATMSVGHRILLSELIRFMLPQVQAADEVKVLIAIDKLAKIGAEKVSALMGQIPGATLEGAAALLKQLTQRDADGNTDLSALPAALTQKIGAELDRFQQTMDLLRALTAGTSVRCVADLSIARGLGYYTGVVFETTLDALPGVGSVSSGGRYNDLVSRFSSQILPGVGGSLGVDRFMAALEELAIVSTARHGVFVAIATEDARAYAFSLAQELRNAGVMTDVAVKGGKLGNQFKFADRRSYEWVVTVGSEEQQNRSFSIKNLATGQEQKQRPLSELKNAVQGK